MWNASSWLSTDAAVRKSHPKVSKGLWVSCLVCFNWFLVLLGFSQHITRLSKVVYFNFQNFLVDRKHNQQTLSHFSSGKQDAKFSILSHVNCGTTPQERDSLYIKNTCSFFIWKNCPLFNTILGFSKWITSEMEVSTFPLKKELKRKRSKTDGDRNCNFFSLRRSISQGSLPPGPPSVKPLLPW